MHFFDTVLTFTSTGKSAKGRALQEMARRFEHVLVQGDDAPFKILTAMREYAQLVDKRFRRGRETFVDMTIDRSEESGQITALPVSESVDFDKQPYFRIDFHTVARTATIPEAVQLVKGGEL